MDVYRAGTRMTIDLDKPEDALGLYAVMTGNQAMVSPEIFQKGQKIYSWLFEGVKQLYENYEKEGGVAARPTTAEVITTRKRRTRR